MCIHAFASHDYQLEKAHLVLSSAIKTKTLRHQYFTRPNKSRIMEDLEQENAMYKETLTQFQGEMNIFQGNMNAIMEYIQA